jgi:hypothetical protein
MYLLQELGNGIGHTNAYRRVEPVASGIGEELVGVKVVGCSGQDGGSWLAGSQGPDGQ